MTHGGTEWLSILRLGRTQNCADALRLDTKGTPTPDESVSHVISCAHELRREPSCVKRAERVCSGGGWVGAPRRLVGLLSCGVVAIGLAGCGASSAAPPTVVCGHVLSRSDAGIEVYTIWGRGARGIVRYPTVGNVVYVQVARGCTAGSEVQIRPAGLLRVVRSVRARDGNLAVLVVTQVRPGLATITATRGRHQIGTIRIELLPESPPPSP